MSWGIRFWVLSTVTIHFLWKRCMDWRNTVVMKGSPSTSYHCCSLRTLQKMGVEWLHRHQNRSQYIFSFLKLVGGVSVHRELHSYCTWQRMWLKRVFPQARWYLEGLMRMGQIPCFSWTLGLGFASPHDSQHALWVSFPFSLQGAYLPTPSFQLTSASSHTWAFTPLPSAFFQFSSLFPYWASIKFFVIYS